jgi:hypothetical protein
MAASGAQATLTPVESPSSWKPSPDVRMGGERDVIERRTIEFGLIKNQRPGNFAFGIEAYERGVVLVDALQRIHPVGDGDLGVQEFHI